MSDEGEAKRETFVCGVCKKTFPGVPGGVNTVHGVVAVCSSTTCFASALEHGVSADAMQKTMQNKEPAS